MNDYERYLQKVQSNRTTPDQILRDALSAAGLAEMHAKRRIVAGEISEVYEIELADGGQVIVRIARGDPRRYEHERWAIERCGSLGVPAPEILHIHHESHEDHLSLCIQRKMPGQLLEGGQIDFAAYPQDRKRRIINQAGEILSAIHTVRTHDFGPIDGQGHGDWPTLRDFLYSEHMHQRARFVRIGQAVGLKPQQVERVFDILHEKLDLLADTPPRLSHEDFLPRHILIDEHDRITGIIDWGDVRSDSRVNDFAKWDYYVKWLPLEWLKEGYADSSLFDDAFKLRLHVIKLNRGLGVLEWYYEHDYPERVRLARDELLHDLRFFD